LHITYILIVCCNFWFLSKQLLPVMREVSTGQRPSTPGMRHSATSWAGNDGVHSTGQLYDTIRYDSRV